jgi:hypothetical protein
MIKKGEKGGQVTIFIIIAILIIALGILIYLYYPKIFSNIGPESINPPAYIQDCMQQKIEDTVQTISLQGGDYVTDVNNGYFYKGNNEPEGKYVRYLCYTNENYVHCINQEPFLTEHIEKEILDTINSSIINCFDSMEKSYETKGYNVTLKNGTPEVQIIPKFVSTNFNRTLTLVKGEESQKYLNFDLNLNSNLYDMIEVAKNILIWEMNAGDSAPEAYMSDNPNLKVEKHRKDNDVKVYVLTDTTTEEVFEFAVRSFAAPAGF